MMNQFIAGFVLNILVLTSLVIGIKFSDTHDVEIDQLLKKLNKPALKSIQSPDGDIIDCVHINNHPIYDHPLFKNYTIQMRPSTYPEEMTNEPSDVEKKSLVTQLWTINGKCPKNSIPIKRTKREDILQAKSIQRYRIKDFNNIHQLNRTNSSRNQHEHAIIETLGIFHGARGIINVWKPYVQRRTEFSLAQIWLVAGANTSVNTIEFGWQVCPSYYLDEFPRFFTYWTVDTYNRTGCYNLDCPGFVLTNQEFALDVAIHNFSIMNGQQYEIPTSIWKDQRTGNWWLQVNYNLIVGYWPSRLFNDLSNGAAKVQFGGEIVNVNDVSRRHTKTKMGSGKFADQGYKNTSYIRGLEIFDQNNSWKPFQRFHSLETKPSCYNVLTGQSHNWGNYLYYGGPGRNVDCL